MKRLAILPNIFTSANLLCGLMAMFKILDGDIVTACWLMVIGSVFDAVDGKIAKLTKTESEFGVQFDSLSDMVTFGIAPSLLIYSELSRIADAQLAICAAAFYGGCCAVRLARYNVQSGDEEKGGFTGIPSPAGAGLIVSPVIMMYHVPSELIEKLFHVLPFMSAFLMISLVKYPKLQTHHIFSKKKSTWWIPIAITVFVVASLKYFKEQSLFFLCMGYLLYGITIFVYKAFKSRFFEDEEDILADEEDEFIEDDNFWK